MRRRGPTVAAGVLMSLGGILLVALTVLALLLSGVGLLPRGPAAGAAPPAPGASVVRASLVNTPAQQVITTTLDAAIAPGWQAASGLAWTGGSPFDEPCGRPGVDAAIAGSRVFDVPGRQVVVTISAYSAGGGAVALRDWSDVFGACQGARVTHFTAAAAGGTAPTGSATPKTSATASATPGATLGATASPSATASASGPPTTLPGVDAITAGLSPHAGLPGASSLLWRRGDVVASVTVAGNATAGLAGTAAQVDTVLLAALAGRCANLDSTYHDAARSPWVADPNANDPNVFAGLTTPVPVSVTPSPTPTPPAGVTKVPDTYTPSPVPSISFPTRPADPVWPDDLPTPLETPIVPVKPSPAPSTTLVPSRLDDPTGPGCGWAFTGQAKPPFDAGTEAALAQARESQALADLATAQQTWQAGTLTYWQQVPPYEQELQAFSAYAVAVRQVAIAWDAIQKQRDDYQLALAAYTAAQDARTQFFLNQAAEQSAYDAAVLACGLVPTFTPSPTDSATPTDSLTPSPTDSLSPSPTLSTTPTLSETPTLTPTGTPTCPPPVPPILTQEPPTLPPVPTLPPDPRPSGS